MLRLTTRGRGWRGRATVVAVGVVTPGCAGASVSSPNASPGAPPLSPTTPTSAARRRPLSTLRLPPSAARATACSSKQTLSKNNRAWPTASCAWARPPARTAAAGMVSLAAPRPARTAAVASSPLFPRRAWPVLSDRRVRRLSDQPPSPSPSSPPPPALRENIYTVPNFLTVARLATAPVIGYSIVHDQPGWALGLLVAAGLTDLLDGWIARRWRLRTVVGSILDPLADKVLMTVLTVSLAAQGSLPVWLAVLVLGRDVGLGLSAIYYRWISLPPPKTLARYWDFSLPSAEVRPTTISKYNTFLQLALMAATTAAPVLAGASGEATAALLGGPWDLAPVLTGLQYTVAVTTVWSGLSYVFSKDAVKILSNKGK